MIEDEAALLNGDYSEEQTKTVKFGMTDHEAAS